MAKRDGFASSFGVLVAMAGSAVGWAIYGDSHILWVPMAVLHL